VKVIQRFVVLAAILIAMASMLMVFPSVRALGASLLASAGIAGIALGMAAKPLLQNLLAGLQLALSQPIRLDDVVVVENEWGRIEEITTTFVVVKIWDQRRLILPLSYFIEKPIQTWTRSSAEILGTAYIYADYTVPVQAVRDELEKIVKDSGKWDGRAVGLQVTGATAETLELRALVSAPDGSIAWELRCLIREKLVDFLQREYPQCLPRKRLDMNPAAQSG
jgi:small-conductance mechanosensitive channel